MFVLFDSTFDGLLSAAAWCFRSQTLPGAILPDTEQQPIVDVVTIPRENNVRRLFKRHFSEQIGLSAATTVLDTAYHAFLSDEEGIATPIFHFFRFALEKRKDPSGDLADPVVSSVVNAAKRAGRQAHHYLGLLRFRSIRPDLYLADFSPDCHVLPLILPHFCDRLPDQNFVIRDLKRGLAAVHLSDGRVGIHILENESLPDSATGLTDHIPDRDDFAPIWDLYLKRLSIPERCNPALQQSNMPKKYWKYLAEQPQV